MIRVYSYDNPDWDMNIVLQPESCNEIIQATVNGSLFAELRTDFSQPHDEDDRDKAAEMMLIELYKTQSNGDLEGLHNRLSEIVDEVTAHFGRLRNQD